MPMTVAQQDGQYVVSGVTGDPAVFAPLGRTYFQVGSHYVGFDDNFAEPVVVRAYYDPSTDLAAQRGIANGTIQWIGYLQFMRLSFRGTPIPPDVLGGRLADRTPYVYQAPNDARELRFVDFMDPAWARQFGFSVPFYPYNALLVNGSLTVNGFYAHPLENGSMFAPNPLIASQSAVASLFAEVCVGLATTADLEPHLTDSNLLLTLQPTAQQLAENEAYQLAWNFLASTPLASAPDAGPPLAGIDKSQVGAQLIGGYVLLTLPDPEELSDTLVVSTAARTGGGTDVLVHVLSDYDMADMYYMAGREALWRIRQYQLTHGLADSEDLPDAPPAGRGRSGLYSPPYTFQPGEFALELRYWTMAVAGYRSAGQVRNRMLNGFTWSALFEFNEDDGSLTFDTVRKPVAASAFALGPALRAYRAARDGAVNRVIDTTNFTLAAMRRDNFAAGSKLNFLSPPGGVST
ncbi:MAG: hypothetical protein ABSA53_25285 [Streptosporangiaceae bacterium]